MSASLYAEADPLARARAVAVALRARLPEAPPIRLVVRGGCPAVGVRVGIGSVSVSWVGGLALLSVYPPARVTDPPWVGATRLVEGDVMEALVEALVNAVRGAGL